MKKVNQWLKNWGMGYDILLGDDCVSFYVYFSFIFAEIAYFWTRMPEIALPFTCLNSLCILNVLVCSYFKGVNEGRKAEAGFARAYLVVFALIFGAGFFFGWQANIILFVVPFVATGIFLGIRTLTDTLLDPDHSIVQRMFQNPRVCMLGIITVAYVPFFVFAYFLHQTSLMLIPRVLISVVYAFLIPAICYIEDSFSACTIFEIGFDVSYDKNFKDYYEKDEDEY